VAALRESSWVKWFFMEKNMSKFIVLWALAAGLSLAATNVVILGTGTPRADPERSGPSVAIVYRDKAYLFDSGPGVVRRAAGAAARLHIPALAMPNLQRVFLTHLHSDHTLGLPDLIFSPWVLRRTAPLEVYGPKGTKAMVDHIEAAWQQDIDLRIHGLEHGNATGYRANAHEIEAGVVFREDDLEISAIPVHHGSWPQAFGYRIATPERTIVISGDCAPSPALIKACNGCDVLLHEVYSMPTLKQPGIPSPAYFHEFHTSTEELARIAAEAKPKLLILYHQIMTGSDDELVSEIKTTPATKVVSAHDLDLF
jgi:ribonuclease BN (tRNA processing enzyme)